MLEVAVQPPSRARPGVALSPPVAARLRSETSMFEELSQKYAVASLIDHSGEALNGQLGGKVTDSAHPLPESTHGSESGSGTSLEKDRAYFYFPGLIIHDPGRYTIRITLMEMDYSCDSSPEGESKARETVESRSIVVEDTAPSHARPQGQELAFLRILKDDGQDVPSHTA